MGIDDKNECVVDPQMHEIVWMNSIKFAHLSGPTYKQGLLQQIGILYQKYLWLPICILFGRIGIVIDSWKDERSLFHLSGFVLHHFFIFIFYFLPFDEAKDFFIFYGIALACQGVLTLQLLVSH